MIYSFGSHIPSIHPSSYIHPLAAVTGNVVIGRNVYVGPGAAIRGDWGAIIIGDGCNVQESCTIHMFPGVTVILVVGNPGKVIREVNVEMMAWKTEGTAIYQNLPEECRMGLRPVLSSYRPEADKRSAGTVPDYKPWKSQ